MDDIKSAWDDFQKVPFPDELAIKEIDDVNIADIDSAAAGCIDTYLEKRKISENDCARILNECADDLNKVKNHYVGEEREYIEKLYKLILMVLKRVNH